MIVFAYIIMSWPLLSWTLSSYNNDIIIMSCIIMISMCQCGNIIIIICNVPLSFLVYRS